MSKDARLPLGWVFAPLGILGDWAGGGTPSKENPAFWANGSIPWISPKDMKSFEIHDAQDHITEAAVSESSATRLPAGTVLMVTRSGILRHTLPVAVTRREVTLNQDMKGLTPYKDLSPDFVAYALRHFAQSILHLCAKGGTTVQSIEFLPLKRFEIPVAPFSEQRRIVSTLDELLSELDAGIEALRRAQTKLKHYWAAVLKAAVEGRLTAEWRKQHSVTEPASELLSRILSERRRLWEEEQLRKFGARGKKPPGNWQDKYPQPISVNPSKLPALPKDWSWATWSQLGFSQNGRAFPSNDYQHQGVKLLRPGNLYPTGRVEWNDRNTRFLPQRYAQEYPELIVRGRELIMNLTAQSLKEEFLGRACLTARDEHCLLNQRLARLTPILSSPEYLLWVFKSPYFREFVDSLNAGSLIQHMFTSQLESAALPLPPLPEQQAIVEAVEEQKSMVDHLAVDIENKLTAAQALRRSIFHRAFTGKLVPQDPNDEPAEEILKRIAAERARRSSSTSKRRTKTV